MFTAANSMDPGEMPTQLQGFIDIEEMLIARVHPILRVYELRTKVKALDNTDTLVTYTPSNKTCSRCLSLD